MGFRDRLLLALLVLALLLVGLQMGLGYLSFYNSLERDFRGDLEKYALLVAGALDVEGTEPILEPSKLPSTNELQGRFRLLKGTETILEGGGAFPQDNPSWRTERRELGRGYLLEVALNQNEHNRALAEYLRTGWLTMGLASLLAVIFALLLRGYLLRPLRHLEQATLSLAEERFPQPLPKTSRDEIGNLIESFNRMVYKIRKAIEREKTFTRYASHELRTPVATLRATLEAVQGGAMPPEQLIPVLGRNLERIERTLNGLLALARGPGEFRSLEMREFLQSILQSLPPNQRAGVRLEAQPGRVWAPPEALEAALRNLLENAFLHGKPPVLLRFEASPPQLIIHDQGPGVPEEALHRLGTPFYRVTPNQNGLGLGLALVKQMAEAAGGTLALRNHPAGGLEVRLGLREGSP